MNLFPLRIARRLRSAAPGAVALALAPVLSGATPKEIVLEEPQQKARVFDEYERVAVDNAFLDGATGVADPIVVRTTAEEISQTFPIDGGKCYSLSAAVQTTSNVDVTWVFSRTPDNQPLTEGDTTGRVRVLERVGVARFCVDRSGTVRAILRLVDPSLEAPMRREWVMALGSRTETPEQSDARHRAIQRGHTPLPLK